MMPFMMGPMLGSHLTGSGSKQVEAVAQEMIQEGVIEMAENYGQYERISLGQATVKGDFIPEAKFNQLLLDALGSRKEWVVINGEKPLHHAQKEAEGNAKEKEFPTAFVNAQAYQENNLFHLAMEMEDSNTKRILWTGSFSRPMPQSSYAIK
jgi:hypothetical protein